MVNPVSSGGYQAYSYQQATTPVQQNTPRSGENRIERRDAPAADSQRPDPRELASRDERTTAGTTGTKDDSVTARGANLDIAV